MTLVLASASPRRLDLLARIGIVPDAVVGHEQPAAAALLGRVKRVARGGLNDLGHQGLVVPDDSVEQRTADRHFGFEGIDRQRVAAGPGHLDEDVERRVDLPEERRYADRAFAADRCDFGGLAVLGDSYQRADAAGGKYGLVVLTGAMGVGAAMIVEREAG